MRNFTISTLLTGLLATVLALHAPVSEAATSKHKPVAAKSAKHVKPAKAGVKGVKAVKASAKSAKLVKGKARGKVHAKAHVEPVRPSVGQTLGLQHTSDHLALKSNVALVVDRLAGLRSPEAFVSSAPPAEDAPGFFGTLHTDAQGEIWQEIQLLSLSQSAQFLSISA